MRPIFLALISAVLQTAVMVSVIVEWHIILVFIEER
jgi:hypothetical protein